MLAFLTALVSAIVLTGVLVPILRRVEFMDEPNHRSSHVTPTARGGGLAVMFAVLFACGIQSLRGGELPTLPLAAGVVLAGIGFVDDVRSLPGALRLVIQSTAGVSIASWALSAYGARGLATVVFLVVAAVVVVGYVNAFNFMDGINAISSLNAAVAGLWWGYLGGRFGQGELQLLGLAIAGGMLGFLPWNAPRARVFLGDVGSYGLGVLIASLSVWGWAAGVPALLAFAALAVYGADTGWVLVKRTLAGRPLMEAHREHVYQRLVDGGWSHLGSAALCTGVGALVCVVAALTWSSAPVVGVLVIAVLVLGYLNAPRLLLPRLVTA